MIQIIIKPKRSSLKWEQSGSEQVTVQDGLVWRFINRPSLWRPPTDLFETDDALYVRIEIAGMNEADFSLSLRDNLLSVRGTRNDVQGRKAFHQMEIPFGEFSLDLEIPTPFDENKVEAQYLAGFLKIMLPKALPHKIHIKD